MPQPTVSVTPEQVEFFRREGYLAVGGLSTPAELARTAAVYDRLFEERRGWEEGNAFDLAGTDDDAAAALPQILGPSRYAPELRDTLYWANAHQIARQLLGPECQMGGDHAILKPATHGAATPWHQDEAYWNPALDYHSLSVWVPLQDAPIANGCLWFIPRTHTLPVLPHHTVNHDPRIHALEVDPSPQFEALLAQAVACPLTAGAATFHYSRTFHYAGPNHTGGVRRAHILGFSTPATPRTDGRRFPWNETKQTAREARRREFEAAQRAAAAAEELA
ncbi:MAG: phytanoyl-CoA dioxygenase family protein [Fimbriimonadaceae bacterium]|nr:phytanoyl-CoA dioxygenase family protein [Fimbriimonadaceae bacterium]